MLHTKRSKGESRDWLRELNQTAANEVDGAVIRRERRKWPVDLMGGNRRGSVEHRQNMLDAEVGFIPAEPTTAGYYNERKDEARDTYA